MSSVPLLWHFAVSHFTEKARWALDYKAIPHRREMLFLEYPIRAYWRTGQMRLPVLFRDDETICDSTEIIAALESSHPEPPLYPQDPDARARALALEDYFDEELGGALRAVIVDMLFRHHPNTAIDFFAMEQSELPKIVMRAVFPIFRAFYVRRHDINAATVAAGELSVKAALDRVEAEVQPSGYLAGDAFSVADLTAAALLYPIACPPEYPYTHPQSYRDAVADYRDSLASHPALAWAREMYQRHRGKSAAIE